jgi:hypothetical protein
MDLPTSNEADIGRPLHVPADCLNLFVVHVPEGFLPLSKKANKGNLIPEEF